jgi:hypothetical protein
MTAVHRTAQRNGGAFVSDPTRISTGYGRNGLLDIPVGAPIEEIESRYQALVAESAGLPEAEERRRRLRQAYDILKQE